MTYTDGGGGGQPALSTTTQHVVQTRRQQVEFSQDMRGLTYPAVNVAEPDPGGGQVAGSIDNGDYVGLNNRYFFGNMDKPITFRFAQDSPPTRRAAWWTCGWTRRPVRWSRRAPLVGPAARTRTRTRCARSPRR